MDFTLLPLPGGPLEHEETYFYYDGPKAFALRATGLPLYFIVNTVDEDDDTVTNLVATVSPDRFRAIRSGLVTFREAFTDAAPNSLQKLVWTFDELSAPPTAELTLMDPLAVPDEWLPVPGTRLSLPTATVTPYVAEEVVQLARDLHRTMFAFKLSARDATISSFPARASGEFLEAVHSGFQAVKRDVAGRFVDVSELSPSVYDLRAASFVIVLTVDRRDALFEPVDATTAIFEELGSLISVAGSGDSEALLEALKGKPKRVQSGFRDMLRPIAKVGSGIELVAGIAGSGQVIRAAASASDVESSIYAIENAPPEESEIFVSRGLLMGSVLRTGRFEVVDLADGRVFNGDVTEEALHLVNNLQVGDAAYITARIRARIPFGGENDSSPGTRFTLEHIQPFGGAVR